jgi:hypothetical protein
MCPGEQGIAFRLDLRDLCDQELDPVERARDLRLEVLAKRPAVARLQRFQPRPAIAAQRIIAPDAL